LYSVKRGEKRAQEVRGGVGNDLTKRRSAASVKLDSEEEERGGFSWGSLSSLNFFWREKRGKNPFRGREGKEGIGDYYSTT